MWCPERMLRDERGGGTIMGLFWCVVMIGVCGLAIDVTGGFHNRTMLQATADASALAAVIDLPVTETQTDATAKATAITYSKANMATGLWGDVLKLADVVVGTWDPATRSMGPSGTFPDAVFVTTRRADVNGNPVPVIFLRILGLLGIDFNSWNVRAQAVAQRYTPKCLYDGLIARETVEISSNNNFVRQICIHSQLHVKVQNHNYYEPGVSVSMPDADELQIPTDGMATNVGLADALKNYIFDPRMVDQVPMIIDTLLDPTLDALDTRTDIVPDYVGIEEITEVDNDFDFSTLSESSIWDAGTQDIYHVLCTQNPKKLTIPSDTILTDLVIVSDCPIFVGQNVQLGNVTLVSQFDSGKLFDSTINFANGVQLGRPDDCTPGGGVSIYTTQSLDSASALVINGVQIVAQGDVHIAAQAEGINGISVQAGGEIQVTSNNSYGLCAGGGPNLFTADYYRLVL